MRYVGYNHSNSDALTTDECLTQAHCFNRGSNHGKNSVSETDEQTLMVVTEGDRETLSNRVQFIAVLCSCLIQQAQIPAHVVSCWVHAWRAPIFWFPVINKGTRKKSVVAQGARALH